MLLSRPGSPFAHALFLIPDAADRGAMWIAMLGVDGLGTVSYFGAALTVVWQCIEPTFICVVLLRALRTIIFVRPASKILLGSGWNAVYRRLGIEVWVCCIGVLIGSTWLGWHYAVDGCVANIATLPMRAGVCRSRRPARPEVRGFRGGLL